MGKLRLLGEGDDGGVSHRRNSGSELAKRRRINWIEGANVTITLADDPADDEVDVTIAAAGGGGGGGGYTQVQDEGVNLTQRTILNVVGPGLAAADDAANARTNLTLSSGVPGSAGAGDAAAEGTANALARSDHRHGLATGVPSGLANANTEGASAALPRLDHQHKRDVRVKGGASDFTRNALNVAGLTVADDAANDKVDVTHDAASSGHHAQQHALGGGDHSGALAAGQHGDRSAEGGTQHAHGQLSGVTADQHHTQAHAIGGSDHSGPITDAQHGSRGAALHADSHAENHQSRHQAGGADAQGGNLDAIARTTVRKNSGADVGSRRRLNLIEGSGVTLTVADDAANEEVDVTIVASGGGGGDNSWMRNRIADGDYHVAGTPMAQIKNVTLAIAANTLYAMPIYFPASRTADAIAIRVSAAAAAGKKARLGIYSNGANFYPGARVLDAGEVAVDTTGTKSIAISQALADLYWLVVVSDGTPTIQALAKEGLWDLLGSDNLNNRAAGWSVAFTYGALPDPFTSGGAKLMGADSPAIAVSLS